MMDKKKKSQTKLFIGVFIVIAAVMIISNLTRQKVLLLDVPDNAGVTILETVDDALVCVFQDGQVVSWDWAVQQQKSGFKAVSDRAIILDSGHLAAVNKEGKKRLTVYTFPDGQKQEDISVGWEDQDVWLRISPDKLTVALIRRNVPDSKGSILYEFLTLNVERSRIGSSVPVSIQQETGDLIDYAVGNNAVLYAVGSKEKRGLIAAVDLEKGTVLWDRVFDSTKEFCSALISPDGSVLYAGNRDGILYKLNAATGEMMKNIKLLEDGETRPITNDYSVLNTGFSPDGQYLVATIHPKAYIIKTDSDELFHVCQPASRLVSKIAFAPDNQFFATSDIRAGYPVKVWPMPEQK
ncbi:MAG: WD40 repeat domain-containing protein [Planctomycetota bacterium]|jgi:outer membrane protein assembly factor BamB